MRCHLYYPVIKNGHSLVTAAKISFLQPGTDTPINQAVYDTEDGSNALPNPWIATPAVLDIWTAFPDRVRLKVEEYKGDTYYIEDVDILPRAEDCMYTVTPMLVTGAWNAHGMLTATDSFTAAWSTSNTVTPSTNPTLPPVVTLDPGQGNPTPTTVVDQAVTWYRHLADATQGNSPPYELIKFRLTPDNIDYIKVLLSVSTGGAAQVRIEHWGDNGAGTSTLYRQYFPAVQNLAFPVENEHMKVTITGNQVSVFQGSVDPALNTPVVTCTVDLTYGFQQSFQVYYYNSSNTLIDVTAQSNTASGNTGSSGGSSGGSTGGGTSVAHTGYPGTDQYPALDDYPQAPGTGQQYPSSGYYPSSSNFPATPAALPPASPTSFPTTGSAQVSIVGIAVNGPTTTDVYASTYTSAY